MAADYKFRIIGIDATKKAFASIKTGLQGVRTGVNSTAAKMVIFAGPAVLGAVISQTLAATTQQTRLARSLGVSTDVLSEWTHAAATVNVEGDKMADIFKDVQDKIGDFATTGGGGAIDMFEKLNLDIHELVRLAPDQQLIKIGAALDTVETQAEKIFFLEALAGDASLLLPLLENNSEALLALSQEARDFGVSVSEVDAAKMEAATRSLERARTVAGGLAKRLTVQVAPIIGVIAERFVTAATEGDRMGTVVNRAMNFAVKTVGVFADGLRGIDIIWTALKIGAQLFAAGVLLVFKSLITGAINAGQSIINFVLAPLRSGIKLAARFSDSAAAALVELDRLTTIKTPEFLETMGTALDGLMASVTENRAELQALLLADLPSAVIEGKWQEIQAEAERRAIEVSDKIREQLDAAGAGGTGVAAGETAAEKTAREEEEVRERDRIAAQLLRLDEQHFTELEKITARQQAETDIVNAALEQRLIDETEHKDRINEIDQEAHDASIALTEAEAKFKRDIIINSLGMIANIQNTKSKKLFKVQKAAALAQAAVALPAAVIDSFKNAGGYPFGLIPAAAMLATGIAQIQNIRKTRFGGGASTAGGFGGGGGGGGDGGGPRGPGGFGLPAGVGSQFNQGPVDQGRQNITHITIAGDVVGDSAEMMIEKLKTLINEGDTVLIDPNSRQAQEIVAAGVDI